MMLHKEEKIARITELLKAASERELGIAYAFILSLIRK